MFDLKPFCGTKDFARYALTTPWHYSGWQYASDGTICVRVPAIRPIPSDEEDRPKAFTLFEQFPECTEPWPEHDGTEKEYPCSACGGLQSVECECPECGTPHNASCKDCVNGTELRPKSLTIAGRRIVGKYCLKIQALGTVLFCSDGEAEEPVAFQCGELEGLVNPRKKKNHD